jgi:alanine racemase
MTTTRPTWAEVSRNKLKHNHDVLRRLAGPATELLAVVKANAYGHGLADCARALESNGARWFGVTSVDEGVELRRVTAAARILVMSGIFPGEAEAAIEHNLTPVVWEPQHLDSLQDAARRIGKGSGAVPVHLEIDTGMSRQGVQRPSLESLLERINPESPLRIEALMTHFHSPDDGRNTHDQLNEFLSAIAILLARRGIRCDFVSAGSSANLLLIDETTALHPLAKQMGGRRMVRAGIALYGYSPLPANENAAWGSMGEPTPVKDPGLKPVLSWKTRVIALRDIQQGTSAGYSAKFTAKRPTRLALLPVGYADGLNWQLWERASVLVRGRRAPLAGRISMDQTMVDVTDVAGVAGDDEVALIGEQATEKITANEMASLRRTIAYEVLCNIGARVPRVMVD